METLEKGMEILARFVADKKYKQWTIKTEFLGMYEFLHRSIVGSGVFVLTGIVIGLTGHGAPYGFVLAALIAVCQLVPMATLASSMLCNWR